VVNTQQAPAKQVKFWNDPEKRSIIFQVIAMALVIGGFYYIINNALTNMEQRGITTGFDFLSREAGFGIIQTLIEYSELSTFGDTFIVGLLNTILISVIGIFLATILGFIIGVARLSDNWIVSKMATVYIEIFRNIPLLLQMFFWYFAVLRTLPLPKQSVNINDAIFLNIRGLYLPDPILGAGFNWVTAAFVIAIVASIFLVRFERKKQKDTGQTFPLVLPILGLVIGLPAVVFFIVGSPLTWDYPALRGFNFEGGITIIPEFMALLTALVVYTAAFIAEVVRSGIEAVPKGQSEAASSVGLSYGLNLRKIVIPQAMRVIIPPLTNQYLNLMKNSSLATAIGYPDLVSVFAGTTLNQTGQAIEVIFMTMAVYLVLSLTLSFIMNTYNKRVALVER
jgi:general L-amino acid transport system permease protein